MDKWSYTILNIIFFIPVIAFLFFRYKEIIFKKLHFVLMSGLFGAILVFIIDLPATNWKAWQYDYTKTLGINFGKSVFEELVWVILICMIVAIIIEIFFERQKKTSEALKWIVNILNKHNVPFQIT